MQTDTNYAARLHASSWNRRKPAAREYNAGMLFEWLDTGDVDKCVQALQRDVEADDVYDRCVAPGWGVGVYRFKCEYVFYECIESWCRRYSS